MCEACIASRVFRKLWLFDKKAFGDVNLMEDLTQAYVTPWEGGKSSTLVSTMGKILTGIQQMDGLFPCAVIG